ncbi:hypothetical protein FH972_001975 [Carpinus fangiana]|uniref:Uncharacterized protein n=1 Tax=Carpinus fangiana TaxID=176857 RepID=A0A5N6QGQ9_9ROSI|nr:hypothetical protein FH972_001975 [Carpinus fangiana]
MAPLSLATTTFPLFLCSLPIPCTRFHPFISLSSALHPHRPSISFPSNPRAPQPRRPCHAASPGPPPDSDPRPPNDPVSRTGLAASLSKFQDRVQIFFAVLFWMSLFFWASAWDGRSRPNKGSRFRK